MKIAFHICRKNWYRVLSAPIEEALKMGWEVECWHNVSVVTLGKNTADAHCVPAFRFGAPRVVTYAPIDALSNLVKESDADAIVDLMPPAKELMSKWPSRPNRPPWVVLEGPTTANMMHYFSEEQMYNCDLFAVPTVLSRDATIQMMRPINEDLIERIRERRDVWGENFESLVRSFRPFCWQNHHKDYYSERSVCVGWPELDIIDRLDPEEIRARWGLPAKRAVVAFLPFAFGNVYGALWERVFAATSSLRRIYWTLRERQPGLLRKVLQSPNDDAVVGSIDRFCKYNNALLVTKLRHSSNASRRVSKVAYRTIGEEGYNPHTALELYRIAALTVSYFSSGVVEAIACGSYHLNIMPQWYPDIVDNEITPLYQHFYPPNGVNSNMDAAEAVCSLPKRLLGEYQIDAAAREKYLAKLTGPLDGKSSSRFLTAVRAVALGCQGKEV